MAYTLVTANRNYSSWSLRPWLLMKALGIAFTDRIEPFAAVENYEAFRAFSPTGQVPVLLDGERTVGIRWASRSIWPNGTPAYGPRMKRPAPGPCAPWQRCMVALARFGPSGR